MSEASPLPPMADAPISLVLPIHDQAPPLKAAVIAWVEFLTSRHQPFEVLLIDDASSDATAEVCAGLAQRFPQVRVQRHERPSGLGACLRTALTEAKHPLFAYALLDEAYSPADLKRLLSRIDPVHVVTGYRASRPFPRFWTVMSRIFRLLHQLVLGVPSDPLPGWLGWREHSYSRLVRFVFGVQVRDINSGLKVYRRSLLERIPIQSEGDFVHAELLAKVNFLDALIDEVPISSSERPYTPCPRPAEPSRWADARRVFHHPDFGERRPEEKPVLAAGSLPD